MFKMRTASGTLRTMFPDAFGWEMFDPSRGLGDLDELDDSEGYVKIYHASGRIEYVSAGRVRAVASKE